MSNIAQAIAAVRTRIEALQNLLARWDAEIAADPDDSRDRIGRLPGLERVLPLSAALLDRLEEDIAAGRIARGAATAEDTVRVMRGLEALERVFESARLWQQTDEIDRALTGMIDAAAMAESCLSEPRDDQPGRFYHDLGRISEDVRVMASMLELFQRNRRRNPHLPAPEVEADWSASRWFEMLLDQACREERLIDVVEKKGLSLETLQTGLDASRQDERDRERETHLHLSSHASLDKRGQVFDPDDPKTFLDLPEIPALDIENEFDVENSGDGIVEINRKEDAPERDNHGFTIECPEHEPEPVIGEERAWSEDPVLEFLEPAVFAACRALGDARDPEAEAGALHNYVALALLKPLARIASSYVHCENAGSMAPVHGAYLFAMHCLDRASTALENFGDERERAAAVALRGTRLRVSEFF